MILSKRVHRRHWRVSPNEPTLRFYVGNGIANEVNIMWHNQEVMTSWNDTFFEGTRSTTDDSLMTQEEYNLNLFSNKFRA